MFTHRGKNTLSISNNINFCLLTRINEMPVFNHYNKSKHVPNETILKWQILKANRFEDHIHIDVNTTFVEKKWPVTANAAFATTQKENGWLLRKEDSKVCPIIHCCNSTTPYWITASTILFYMVPCKEGHLCACNSLGKRQPLVKRNIFWKLWMTSIH